MLLPETSARIDALVSSRQSQGRAPSLIAAVVRDGAVAHVAAAGTTPEPTADTQYRIGSITKTFTAAMIMQLRDEGRLELDDLLQRHMPGAPVGGVSVRQLLGHVSGLRREPDGPWWERAAGTSLEEFLDGLDPGMLVHKPHRQFHYSNVAYGLLSAIARRITGESWIDLVGKRLLTPLGLTRTTYAPQEPFARGYVVHPWHDTLREEPRHDAGAMAPAGQLWSTVEDMARWAGFIARPDPDVVNPTTVDEMTAPVAISDLESWSAGQGLGFQLWRRGERVLVGHSGSMPGYVAFLTVHRTSGVAAVVFANAYNITFRPGELCGDIVTEVLDREPEPPRPWRPSDPPPAAIAELCGRWWFMGTEFEASADGDELAIRPMGSPAPPWRFAADGPDRWRGRAGMNDGEALTLRRDSDGRVVMLDIATFEFTRDPWPDI
ncbi:MAG: serine hydrolase [Micromonosporaceae bacterium]|nr:serine hydrolase [Micromonosporaceae bacterium]